MSELISTGKCLYCNQEVKKGGITRHLNKHLLEKSKEAVPGISFHLRIDTTPRWGTSPYFLNLLVDGEALMKDIDEFLRNIWLECCGHLSAFRNRKQYMQSIHDDSFSDFDALDLLQAGKIKEYEAMMEKAGEIPKDKKAKDVFTKYAKLDYEYDFGSSTELQLTVAGTYPSKADNIIVLLSRNEPPELLCDICHTKPASQVCAVCNGHGDSLFCAGCAVQHKRTCSDFKDYANMPAVNSPRMAVCAYKGGSIDKARDGIFNKEL